MKSRTFTIHIWIAGAVVGLALGPSVATYVSTSELRWLVMPHLQLFRLLMIFEAMGVHNSCSSNRRPCDSLLCHARVEAIKSTAPASQSCFEAGELRWPLARQRGVVADNKDVHQGFLIATGSTLLHRTYRSTNISDGGNSLRYYVPVLRSTCNSISRWIRLQFETELARHACDRSWRDLHISASTIRYPGRLSTAAPAQSP